MVLLELVEAPAASALHNDGAADREPHARVGIEHDAAALQQVVEVLRRGRQVWNGLRVGLDRNVRLLQALGRADQLKWIEVDFAHAETLGPIEQRVLDQLEVDRIAGTGHEHAVRDETNDLGFLVEGAGDERR